ncbi:eukaryotic translation initiation factor 5B isoform X2 [Daphnia magna]|uniref:eukaryotic translation initiation factor 5B isoform X2 n=1 Tax=Daphnia magna TaxID=35525 RepID=UPI001E1BA366|nr:eukaryotic translation initiation factor 5B isoform X2 [Daphnia magna]
MAKGNQSILGENMRNVHFRSRTFVIIGCALAGFALFSYWGLSTQNSDLHDKIERLEDNLNIGTRKQRDLEDELQAMVKKSNDLLKANAKLQSELQQKENLISAQGVEGSQWRDKVRNAETEVEKFKADIADKVKKLQDLQKQVASYSQDILLKESKLSEAQELIKKLEKDPLNVHNITEHLSNLKVASSSSAAPAADPSLVLAKPNNEKSDDDVEKKLEKRQENEPVVGRPQLEESAPAVKPDEELELVDPKDNVVEHPEVENDETKFKEIREEMDIGELDKNAPNAVENSKELNEANDNNVIDEPNLINSQGENLDEEPALLDTNPRFRNFKARVMHKKTEDDNLPEDQEIENEHDDDRVDN